MRESHATGAAGIAGLLIRMVTGVIFVAFGIGKFTSHATELASFRDYGLPFPDAFVYLIGAVEVLGGLLLICGLATRPASLILAANMVGAIVVSGIGRGEMISLTLAPALLVAVLMLLRLGPGRWALDPSP
ncbi:MAG: DoxX family protein [Solirubrobacteraceae bacterium]